MGHYHELPLTGVMELRPDQLRHHPEISPRDFKELRPNHIQIRFLINTSNPLSCHNHADNIFHPIISYLKFMPKPMSLL